MAPTGLEACATPPPVAAGRGGMRGACWPAEATVTRLEVHAPEQSVVVKATVQLPLHCVAVVVVVMQLPMHVVVV